MKKITLLFLIINIFGVYVKAQNKAMTDTAEIKLQNTWSIQLKEGQSIRNFFIADSLINDFGYTFLSEATVI